MRSRSEELRREQRRVFGVSLLIAVVFHVVVFLTFPGLRAEILSTPDMELDTTGVAGGANAWVDLLFGPTVVKLEPEGEWIAPPERFLEADRPIRLSDRCLGLASEDQGRLSARVGLRIKASGRVDVLGVVSGTGSRCADDILSEAAGALWYHWLPNDDFAAPLLVEQPVTLVATYLAGL